MTKTETIITNSEEHLFHVYNRFPVAFTHGEGMYLYDAEGKKYLDFASGIGVNAFGYSDEKFLSAVHNQVDQLLHISNLFYHPALETASASLCEVSQMDKVFFTNSGAEAIEGAIKTAKKYALLKHNKKNVRLIAMGHSFHGRTIGALSVTGNDHYREPFYPLMDGVDFAEFNDLSSVEKLISNETCAIITEPVQGEGGLYPADPEFLKGLRKLCDEHGILLIFDEIQCGMGRTGAFYTWQEYGVRPDILTTAKALGGGLPVGAFCVTNEVAAHSLVPGDHGTTYGGNPLVCAGVTASVERMKELNLPEKVKANTSAFEKVLDDLCEEIPAFLSHRGMGYMQGIVVDEAQPVGEIVKKCLDAGLVVLSAEGNVLRMLPPLICQPSHMEEMAKILRGVFL